MITELKKDNLAEILINNKTVIVKYLKYDCSDCQKMLPKFEALGLNNKGASFVIVDTKKFPVAKKFADVTELPAFATFLNGNLVNHCHTLEGSKLEEIVEEVVVGYAPA